MRDAAGGFVGDFHLASVGHLGGEFGEIVLRVVGKRRSLQMRPVFVGGLNEPHHGAQHADPRGRDRIARLKDGHDLRQNQRRARKGVQNAVGFQL